MPLGGGVAPEQEELEALAAEAQKEINGCGRVVIRPSGTEPVVRIMVQHESIRKAEALAKQLAKRLGSKA